MSHGRYNSPPLQKCNMLWHLHVDGKAICPCTFLHDFFLNLRKIKVELIRIASLRLKGLDRAGINKWVSLGNHDLTRFHRISTTVTPCFPYSAVLLHHTLRQLTSAYRHT